MTPEERIAQLEAQIAQLMDWKRAREIQAIAYPIDDASRNIIGGYQRDGVGTTTLTASISIGAGGGSATVPAPYLTSRIIKADGERIEVPVLSLP